MAISVDVLPAYIETNGSAVTTSSFTPRGGSLLVAMVGVGNSGLTAGVGQTLVTDTGSHTWTRINWQFISGGASCEIWCADSLGSSITVTATSQVAGQNDVGIQVISYSGALPAASQLTTGPVSTGSTVAITPTVVGSQIVGSFGYPTSVTLTATANTTIFGQANGAGDTVSAFKATALTPSPLTFANFGFTNTTNSSMAMAAIEILPGVTLSPVIFGTVS